jgi:hypothetical protein
MQLAASFRSVTSFKKFPHAAHGNLIHNGAKFPIQSRDAKSEPLKSKLAM